MATRLSSDTELLKRAHEYILEAQLAISRASGQCMAHSDFGEENRRATDLFYKISNLHTTAAEINNELFKAYLDSYLRETQ